MTALLKRNLLVFFRDKAGVFFSLLAVIILIGLYAIFLGDTLVSGLENLEGISNLMNSWVLSGILAVVSVTTTMGALGVMVNDHVHKIDKDFVVAPIGRSSIATAYVLNAGAVGIIMSLIAFVIGQVYIVISGGEMLSFEKTVQVIGCIFLAVLSSSAIVFFIVSFFKSQNAYSAASTVIGTVIGFLIGAYIPIGSLPEGVQSMIRVFPVAYSATAFRQILMERPMEVTFNGAPDSAVQTFKEDMGVAFNWNGQMSTITTAVIVMVATAVVFYILALARISAKRK